MPKHYEPPELHERGTQRILLMQPDVVPNDFERVEDLAADAIAAARAAREAMEDLPVFGTKTVSTYCKMIAEAVERRKVLTDDFRHAAASLLRHLAQIEATDEMAAALHSTSTELRDALNLSHRVCDLLAAERDIGWHRGIGR